VKNQNTGKDRKLNYEVDEAGANGDYSNTQTDHQNSAVPRDKGKGAMI
jgi:hypothetical protein